MIRLLLVGWAIAAALQLVLWLVARRTRNAGIVDVGWSISFTLVVVTWALLTHWSITTFIVIAWSLRLTIYLVSRGAATGPEEGRYVELRRKWQPNPDRRFFIFFQAQAALTGLLSLAFVVPFIEPLAHPTLLYVGSAISIIGILGESIADAQLAAFKRAKTGGVCERGLWAYSRHPNYFFEWCVWLGYAVTGFAFAPIGLVALIPQAILLLSILFVTGIPPTENQALRSKGDVYRDYQRRVSAFVPRPPKRS